MLAVAVWILCPGAVLAAGYSVLPRVIDVAASPRDILEQKVVIKNDQPFPVTIFTFVNNVTVGLDGGVQDFVPPSMSDRTNSLSSWIEIVRAGFDIPAQGSKELPLTIRVDPHAQPGIYHAIISFGFGGNDGQASAQVSAGTAPSLLLTVTLAKPSNDSLKLQGYTVRKFVSKSAPDNLSYTLTNIGDTELRPSGDVLLYNQKGIEVGALVVNPEGKTIAPNDSATFSLSIPTEGLMGKYKAFITVRYGSNGASIYDTIFFYAAPLKKIIIAFGIFVVVGLMLALWVHHRYAGRSEGADDEFDDVPLERRSNSSGAHVRDIVIKKR